MNNKFSALQIPIFAPWGLLFRNREGYNTHLNYLSVIIVINFQKDLSNRTKVFTQKKLEKVDLVITDTPALQILNEATREKGP